jgi:hypothetical protein
MAGEGMAGEGMAGCAGWRDGWMGGLDGSLWRWLVQRVPDQGAVPSLSHQHPNPSADWGMKLGLSVSTVEL